MYFDFLLFLFLYIFGLSVRTFYEVRKKSGRIDLQNKIIFIAVFAAMGLFFAGWFGMCITDPWKIALPDIIRWLFLGIFIAGLVLAFGALIQLRGVENIQHLVVDGIFKKLRHPMYHGIYLLDFGLVGLSGSNSQPGNRLYRHRQYHLLALAGGKRTGDALRRCLSGISTNYLVLNIHVMSNRKQVEPERSWI